MPGAQQSAATRAGCRDSHIDGRLDAKARTPVDTAEHSMNSPKVVVEGLCKVFGSSPKEAIAMLAAGATKKAVFARTGQIARARSGNVSS